MANWCWTDCKIICKSNKDRNIIMGELDKVKEEKGIENGFGDLWLGNLLYHIGYPKNDICNGKVCECRGGIQYFDESKDKEVQLGIESAWEPMLKVIRLFADKYISDYKIRYVSEESGCGLFLTNMKDVQGKYEVDAYDADDIEKLGITDDELGELFSEKELKTMLKKALGYRPTDKVSIEKLLLNAEDVFKSLTVNKYEYCSLDEMP